MGPRGAALTPLQLPDAVFRRPPLIDSFLHARFPFSTPPLIRPSFHAAHWPLSWSLHFLSLRTPRFPFFRAAICPPSFLDVLTLPSKVPRCRLFPFFPHLIFFFLLRTLPSRNTQIILDVLTFSSEVPLSLAATVLIQPYQVRSSFFFFSFLFVAHQLL